MRKNSLCPVLLTTAALVFLSACGSGKEPAAPGPETAQEASSAASVQDETDDKTQTKEDKPAQTANETDNAGQNETKKEAAHFDITTQVDIWNFLEGDWRLCDPINGEDYATLSIGSDGKCSYRRDTDAMVFDGTLEISKHYTWDVKTEKTVEDDQYTSFKIDVPKMPVLAEFPKGPVDYVESCTTLGDFHVARDDKYDYLYMRYHGNDISYIFENVFQNYDRLEWEYRCNGSYRAQDRWVFVRANDGSTASETEPVKNTSFYGLVWNREVDGTLDIQAMDSFMYEAYEDYTGRHYFAGYFSEKEDISLTGYELSPDVDTKQIFKENTFYSPHPLMMCRITTDDQVRIEKITEPDESYYGIYDLGDLPQDYSYEGRSFTVNGVTIELGEDIDSPVNAITDMRQVGDWVVIDGHVNPHMGAYYLFNIYHGWISKTIWGASLTWLGDDITTAVYSSENGVYDFKDNLLGTTDGTEVYDIKYNKSGSMLEVTDMNGKTYSMEAGAKDTAMYRYADFVRSRKYSDWRAFMEEAPGNAAAFIMGNPPYEVQNIVQRVNMTDGGSDYLYVVALEDNTKVRFDRGNFDVDSQDFHPETKLYETTLNKGQCVGFQAVLTEGVPDHAVYVITDDAGAIFPVTQISGKNDGCGAFITKVLDRDKADEESAAVNYDEFDLLDSYQDILLTYKEAQTNAWSMDKMLEEGLNTELMMFAWPEFTTNDEVKYLLYDVNSDGTKELIITYYGSIVDIWGTDGKKVLNAYGCLPKGEAELYEGGLLCEGYSISASMSSTTWYRFEAELGEYFPCYCENWEADESDPDSEKITYSVFPYMSRRDEIVNTLKGKDTAVSWVWDETETTFEEYKKFSSGASPISLPDGEPISSFIGF